MQLAPKRPELPGDRLKERLWGSTSSLLLSTPNVSARSVSEPSRWLPWPPAKRPCVKLPSAKPLNVRPSCGPSKLKPRRSRHKPSKLDLRKPSAQLPSKHRPPAPAKQQPPVLASIRATSSPLALFPDRILRPSSPLARRRPVTTPQPLPPQCPATPQLQHPVTPRSLRRQPPSLPPGLSLPPRLAACVASSLVANAASAQPTPTS